MKENHDNNNKIHLLFVTKYNDTIYTFTPHTSERYRKTEENGNEMKKSYLFK